MSLLRTRTGKSACPTKTPRFPDRQVMMEGQVSRWACTVATTRIRKLKNTSYGARIQIRVCRGSGPAECREIHAREQARRTESPDRNVATPNHAQPDSRNRKSPQRTSRADRHSRLAPPRLRPGPPNAGRGQRTPGGEGTS